MAPITPWFPLNFELLPGLFAGRPRWEHAGFQIVDTQGRASSCLMAKAAVWSNWEPLLKNEPPEETELHGERLSIIWTDRRALAPVSALNQPRSRDEAVQVALSLKRTRQVDAISPLGDSVFCERLALLLPVEGGRHSSLTDAQVLGRYLSGGLTVSCFATDRIAALSLHLSAADIEAVARESGIPTEPDALISAPSAESAGPQGEWRLPGRQSLEHFFRENVIEVVRRPEVFAAMGVPFPSAFVLHGPPGTGKTFAVQALVDYLRWPVFHADASSLGSPYIHETSRKIADLFRNAAEHAPSIVVIDELESYLAERSSRGQHALEEMAEFLRVIPTLPEKRVLLAAMTNRLDLIDSAILRRGRIDHMVFVDMPAQSEIVEILRHLFHSLPTESSIDLDACASRLVGRPVSDASFVARESGRIAALANRSTISQADVTAALDRALGSNGPTSSAKRIGF